MITTECGARANSQIEPASALNVLVIGGARVGFDAAHALAGAGCSVTLVGPHAPDSERIRLMPNETVAEVQGFVRNFFVKFLTAAGPVIERFDYIVAAAPAQRFPKFSEYGLTQADTVQSLSQFASSLSSGAAAAVLGSGDGSSWRHVAFLCGLEADSDPSDLETVLDCMDALRPRQRTQCYVFTGQLKVAAAGLEERCRRARDAGVIFFKFDDHPLRIENPTDKPTLVFSDPLLDSEIELVPDMLVVDEHKRPPALDSLSMCIPSAPAFEPYLTPESPRYPSVVTPKAGIIAVGPARGVFGRNEILADIRAAVEHISADARLETSAPVCVSEKCAICLTCVRMCPHGALGFTHIASPDAASCRECGICAAECPMSAIRFTPATLGAEVSAAAENAVHLYGTGSTVAFLCEKSGAQAFESVKDKAPAGVLPVVVPCAGSIGPTHIMEALTAGARSVIVAGCFSGNCASIYGTDLARERAASVTAMLAEMGIDTSRVSYLPLASNAGSRLLRHLERVCGEA